MKYYGENVEVGDVVMFMEGKKGNTIAYSGLGKVVLCKHKIPLGYAIVKTVEDKGNYCLVTAKHIVKDYYNGIGYKEFLEVLSLHGFKVGFDIPFTNPFDGCEEREIFAYNLDNHCIIVAETIDGMDHFNSIDLYCPNMNAFSGWMRCPGFTSGSSVMTKFDLVFRHGIEAENSLSFFNESMAKIKERDGVEWYETETPSLWNYADDSRGIWDKTIDRILLADSEVDVIFKNSKRMKEVLAKRVA